MTEYKEVRTVIEEPATSSNILAIFVIAVIALFGIAIIFWQPWNRQESDTTVITQPAQPNTTIVNPPNTTVVIPPAAAPKTEININEGSSTSSGTNGETEGGTTSSTGQ